QVRLRLNRWIEARKTQSQYHPQLEWEANVAEIVLFLHRETRAPAVPQGSAEISSERVLRSGIPIYCPRFLLPVYYDNLGTCPHCGSTDVKWDSWNATGSQEVHGLGWEET
ncbi:hypothetical protein C8J57DRAFT_1039655, partial [Mycena rebaudengoi]